jgi:hypothetical protein
VERGNNVAASRYGRAATSTIRSMGMRIWSAPPPLVVVEKANTMGLQWWHMVGWACDDDVCRVAITTGSGEVVETGTWCARTTRRDA